MKVLGFSIIFYLIHFLSIAQTAELVIQNGHYEAITSLAFSKDGKYLVSGSEDMTIKVWHLKSGKSYRTLYGHDETVTALKFTKDGKTLISAAGRRNPTLIFWDWQTGKILHRIEKAHGNTIEALELSNSGKLFATGSYKELKVWNMETKECLIDINAKRKPNSEILIRHTVHGIAFSADDQTIVTGSADRFLRFWNTEDGSLLREINLLEEKSRASTVAFSADGKKIYHSSSTDNIVIRQAKDGKILKQFENASGGYPCPCQFSRDLKRFFTACGSGIRVQSTEDGSLLFKLSDEYFSNKALAFYDKGNILAVSGINTQEQNTIRLFNAKTGARIKLLEGYPGKIVDLQFSHNNEQLLSGNYQRPTRLWELASAFGFRNYLEGTYSTRGDIGSTVLFSPDDEKVFNGVQGRIYCWDTELGSNLQTIMKGSASVKQIILNQDGKRIYQNMHKVNVWDSETGELLHTLPGAKVMTRSLCLSPDGKILLLGGYRQIARYDTESFEKLPSFETKAYAWRMTCHPTQDLFALQEGGALNLRKQSDGTLIKQLSKKIEKNPVFSKDGKFLATTKEDTIILRETENYQIVRRFLGHKDRVSTIDFSYDNRLLASGSDDTTIKLWDVKTGKLIATLIALDQEDFIITTPDLYYLTSKNGTKAVAFRVGKKVFTFDQFDLQYNRPDIVLERIGYASAEVINAFKRAYEKRLRRLNFNENMFNQDFHLPEFNLLTKDLPPSTREKTLKLDIQAEDTKYKLDRLQVVVNGVPVHGFKGISLRGKGKQRLKQTLDLELNHGINQVQLSVLNEKGVESMRETFEINYEGEVPPVTLHLVTIGVSKYKNSKMDLKYAAKDGQDISDIFQNKGDYMKRSKKEDLGFANLQKYPLFNEEATLANIKNLKKSLKNSQVDDQVLVFVSGHGLLDKNLDYYLATHDINFANPAENGLAYEELENLLDGIPARQKTLFIDACHSGEVDKEEVEVTTAKNTEVGEVTFRSVSNRRLQYKSNMGLENSFNLSKQLFSDLRRRSGATVISSAGGAEYALEGETWKNGVFTYCLLSGFKSFKADLDDDGKIMLSELQNYLQETVFNLTGGKQKPTSRVENLSNDFRVW